MTVMYDIVDSLPWNKKLEVLRISNNWSQEEAAKRCGTTKKNFWLWEIGRTEPRFNSKRAIAMAFGVPMEEIFNDSNIA